MPDKTSLQTVAIWRSDRMVASTTAVKAPASTYSMTTQRSLMKFIDVNISNS